MGPIKHNFYSILLLNLQQILHIETFFIYVCNLNSEAAPKQGPNGDVCFWMANGKKMDPVMSHLPVLHILKQI